MKAKHVLFGLFGNEKKCRVSSVFGHMSCLIILILPGKIMAEPIAVAPAPYCGSSDVHYEPEQFAQVLYQIVSGYPGDSRNWKLMRELFAPSAMIKPVFHGQDGHRIVDMTVERFIELNKKLFSDIGFFETETESKVYRVGHSATIISAYESRTSPASAPYSKGINSFQLVNDGYRWCVISVTWDSDKGGHEFMPLQ
ncbi:hypothetical protein [Bowmanella yangjiangensis]|uniref:Nuclear transport factor 2 family protein n=1 Tax=Bowmanella yangjiangensis TaxID=2811230 RepID=A0ABS3CTP9_9ALTE|nr:hypothetical protein [Bowmanella yangjiangensis]MBN7819806.1 hypothetical protein [Bowmanella yangjiangensis]